MFVSRARGDKVLSARGSQSGPIRDGVMPDAFRL